MIIAPKKVVPDDTAVIAGDVTLAVVPLDGAERARLRVKTNVAATFKFRYVRRDGSTEYTVANPADKVLAAPAEDSVDFDALHGEWGLKIIVNTAAGGVVNFADWSATSPE